MVIMRGILEMLQAASGDAPKSFNDFTKIAVKGRKLSSATVSKRLEELISVKTMEEVITRSKTGRRIIAYKTTSHGRKVLSLAKELTDALSFPRKI